MTRSLVGTLLPCFLLLAAITSRGLSCGSSSKDNTKCSKSDSEKNQKQEHSKETGDHQKNTNTYPSVLYEYYRPTPLLHKQACYCQNQVSYLPRRSLSLYPSSKPSFYPRYYTKRPSSRSYSFYPSQAMPLYDWPSYSSYCSPYQFDSYEDHPSLSYNSYYKTIPIYTDDEPYQSFASEDFDSPNYVESHNDYDFKSHVHDYNSQRKSNHYHPTDDYNDHANPAEKKKRPTHYKLQPKEMKHPANTFNGTSEVSSPDQRLNGKLDPSGTASN